MNAHYNHLSMLIFKGRPGQRSKLPHNPKDDNLKLTHVRRDRMSIDWIRLAQFRPQASQDSAWLKADIQSCLTKDGLSRLWNHLVKDGELTVGDSSFYNSSGALAKKACFVLPPEKRFWINATTLNLAMFL
ncbi:E3 ubiquitin-protein ligase HERC2-like [Elysia marginata]|uniref:E3 ubiquitin-protein ligase HERC2-like n=1 Tax=Elysia marginata TaxID=1093978 RepID=A0AAV4J0G5_9GAST|nr:E3 ubiquitin-protein ligase HERC2-like [Elysia marginata]